MKTIFKLIIALLLSSCSDDFIIEQVQNKKYVVVEVTSNSLMRTYPTCIRDGEISTDTFIDSSHFNMEGIKTLYKDTILNYYSQITVGNTTPSMSGIVYKIEIIRTYTFKQIK